MTGLVIQSTKNTPEVVLDTTKGYFSLRGISNPENSIQFYDPILSTLENSNNLTYLRAEIELVHFNTSSSKCLFDIFKRLKTKEQSGSTIEINWHYDVEDEDMMEIGEDYCDLLDLEFNFIEENR